MTRAESSEFPGSSPFVPWWVWTTIVHLFFIGMLTWVIAFGGRTELWADRAVPLSLSHEGNYSVWWSGVCLLLSGLMFFRLGGDAYYSLKDRVMWITLSLVVLALSVDEVGSLHERVSMLGGWWALLPFGLIGIGAFTYAIVRMLHTSHYRTSGLLVLASLGLFVGVAGLEQLESLNYFHTTWIAQSRLVVEEGVELLAESLLILAAALQISRRTGVSVHRVSIVTMPFTLPGIRELMFAGLVLQLIITVIWMPYLWIHKMGDPAYWYPIFGFLMVAFHCMHRASFGGSKRKFHIYGAVIFVALSTGQMYNHGVFIDAWTGLVPDYLYATWNARAAWTVVPAVLYLATVVRFSILLRYGAVFGLFLVMLHSGAEYYETYYILSGVFCYMCFHLATSGFEPDESG